MRNTISQRTRSDGESTLPTSSGAPRERVTPVQGIGELIADRYRITSLLGQGGMGTVYAALDLTSGKHLALKRLRPALGGSALPLFKREFRTLHGLRHPNIIEVYDYATDAVGPFYTMELLEGGDLGQAAPLPWPKVCKYLRQVAAALGLLHARLLLHRDITPRNIWIFPDGRLKLIDFGALSPFGVPNECVGTPPLLAPEWLAHRSARVSVDQRADLYSLGALGYWLLTGQHAYQAQKSDDALQRWATSPAAPSVVVSQLANASLEPIPEQLDALILALLQPDAAARPESTERAIDRIDAITGCAAEQVEGAGHGWLRSQAFVGRSHELQVFQNRLSSAGADDHAITLEAEPGMGRSRLLEELAVSASLAGATSVLVRAEQREQAYAVANAIALGVSGRLPAEARAAARTHAAVLAQLSPELQRALDLPAAGPASAGRQQLQHALTDWLRALSTQRQIVILVDDIERADEESLSWLTALPWQVNPERVLLVLSLPSTQQTLPLAMFGRTARRLLLAPLTASEIELLLHSVFGPVEYLGRVTSVVQRVSQGSPAHCIELLEHLIDRGLARYAEGAWTLPGQLSENELPRGRSELHLARFRTLSDQAQRLASSLSIHDGQLSRTQCGALSELSEADTAAALVEMVLAGVLRESEQGYAFLHLAVREHAQAELGRDARKRAHARFAAALLDAGGDPIAELRAGLHLWHAGDERRCRRLVAKAVWQLLNNLDRIAAAVGLLVQLVELFRRAHCPARVIVGPLTALAVASYSADPRLAARYGMDALDMLEQLLYLPRAHAQRPHIGAKPALYIALVSAALTRRLDIRQLVFMMILCAGSLNGVAASSFDHELGARCVRALRPFEAFGDEHIAGLIFRTTRVIASMTASEDHAATLAEMRSISALVAGETPIRDMPPDFRQFLLATSYYPIGVMECLRMNPAALTFADRIESTSSLDIVGADQLRVVFHSMRGEHARAAEYLRQVEARALQAGAAWQIVTLGPIDSHFTSLWTHDALLGKRAAAELERLSGELPTLRPVAQRARATYLVLCGRYREAIDTMLAHEVPERVMGWTLAQSVIARAHNRLGEHARARELCLAALAGHSEEDLDFIVMFLHAQLELALAEAALGEHAQARARCQQLLDRHRDVGPLALGAIHETQARVALIAGDTELARKHCKVMRRQYVATENATLNELSSQLAEQIGLAERPSQPEYTAASRLAWLGDDTELTTRSEFFRVRNASVWRERARHGLRLALEMTDAQSAYIVTSGGRRDVISLAPGAPPSEVLGRAEALRSDETTTSPGRAPEATDTLQVDDTRYCLLPIGPIPVEPALPAMLVLAFQAESSALPEPLMLNALARSLRAMLAQA